VSACRYCGDSGKRWSKRLGAYVRCPRATHIWPEGEPAPAAEPPKPGPDEPDPVDRLVTCILRTVAELPDRTSPDDWPEAMLVTHEELEAILRIKFAEWMDKEAGR
jgi:hypothetical protein